MNWFEFLRWRSGYQPQTKPNTSGQRARLRDFISEAQQIAPSGNQDRLQKMQDESLRRVMKERDEMGLNRPGLPEMRSYEPSMRENLNVNLQKMGVPQATATRMAGTNPAISPLGGMLDLMPFVGTALGTEEAGRAAQRGDYVTAGLAGAGSVLDMIPGGAAVAKPVMRGLKALRRVPTEPMRLLPAPTPRAASAVPAYDMATDTIRLPGPDTVPEAADFLDSPLGRQQYAEQDALIRQAMGTPEAPPDDIMRLIDETLGNETPPPPQAPEGIPQDAVDKLNKALLAPDTDFLPKYPAPGKMKPADIMGGDDLMYSPSHLDFGQGQRGKGTPVEWRKEIIKKGGKENELDWMGFDEYFKDKKSVSRDEMHEFFNSRERPYEMVVNDTADGMTGEYLDPDDLQERYIEARLPDETMYYRDEYMPEMLRNDHQTLYALSEEDQVKVARAYAENQYGDPDHFTKEQMKEWIEKNEDYYVMGIDDSDDAMDWSLLDEEDAVEYAYGDPEEMARESLNESVRWGDTSEGEMRDALGLDADFDFNPGDAEHAEYFTPGARNYTERMMTQPLAARQQALPGAPRLQNVPAHMSYADDPQLMHMRTGVYDAEDGGSVFFGGEYQSDWAQRSTGSRGRGMRTLQEEMPYARAGKAKQEAAEEIDYLRDMAENLSPFTTDQLAEAANASMMLPDGQQWRWAMDFSIPHQQRPADSSRALSNFTQSWLRDHYMGSRINPDDIPSHFRPDRHLASPDRSWTAQTSGAGRFGRVDNNLRSLAVEHAMRNQPLPEDGLPMPNPPDVEDYGTLGADLQRAHNQQEAAIGQMNAIKEAHGDKLPPGPYIKKTDDWVRQGLRQGLNDAIMGGHDYFAPNPGDSQLVAAMGHTGGFQTGQANPAVKKFYEGTVAKQLKKLAGSYGEQLSGVVVPIGGDRFAMPAIKLSPEFIKKVEELGIPLFTVGGAAILGATSQQEAEAIVAQQQGRT